MLRQVGKGVLLALVGLMATGCKSNPSQYDEIYDAYIGGAQFENCRGDKLKRKIIKKSTIYLKRLDDTSPAIRFEREDDYYFFMKNSEEYNPGSYINEKTFQKETGEYKIINVSGILFIGMIACELRGTGFGDFAQGAFIWDVSKK